MRAIVIATLVAVFLLVPPATAAMTADFSAVPSDGEAPLTVTFTDRSSSDIFDHVERWAWSFGDGSTSSLPNPTHKYHAAGDLHGAARGYGECRLR